MSEQAIEFDFIYCDLAEEKPGWLRCRRCGRWWPKPRGNPPWRMNCRATAELVEAASQPSGCCGGETEDQAAARKAEEEQVEQEAKPRHGFLKLAAHFASDLKDFATSGFQLVSRQNFDARVAVCADCENRVGRRCGCCGCVVAARARAVAWHCPDGSPDSSCANGKGDRWAEVDARFRPAGP